MLYKSFVLMHDLYTTYQKECILIKKKNKIKAHKN